jgi:hypothetical protein
MPPVTRYQRRLNQLDHHRIAKHTIPVVCISKEADFVPRSPVYQPPTSPAYQPNSDFEYQPSEAPDF